MLENLKGSIKEHKRLWHYLTLFVFVLFFYNGFLIIKIIKGSQIIFQTTLRGILISHLRWNIITIVFIAIILYLGREEIGSLGFKSKGLHKQLAIGAVLGLLFFLFKMWIFDKCIIDPIGIPHFLGKISVYLMRAKAPYGIPEFILFKKGYQVWLVIMVIGGIIDELKRAFIITRFERLHGRKGIVAALLFDFIFYGIGGAWQGGVMSGIKIGISGLIFALIYLRKRNITESMAAHSIADSVALYWMFHIPHRALVFC